MVYGLSIQRKTRCAVRHYTTTLGDANFLTKICFRVQTELAFFALGHVQRNHMVTRFYWCHIISHTFHNTWLFKKAFFKIPFFGQNVAFKRCLLTCTFMAQNHRKNAFRILSGPSVSIRVTNLGQDRIIRFNQFIFQSISTTGLKK